MTLDELRAQQNAELQKWGAAIAERINDDAFKAALMDALKLPPGWVWVDHGDQG